jgi:hypothetical protein
MRRASGGVLVSGLLVFLLAGARTAPAQQPEKPKAQAIQILEVQSEEVRLPPAFQVSLYENLIEQIQKTGRFKQVYRDGDTAAAAETDLLTLRSTVKGFKEGSQRLREATTVAGATSIKVRVQIADRSGKSLLDRDVTGKVVFFGENLRATYNFAKGVAKIVRGSFQ